MRNYSQRRDGIHPAVLVGVLQLGFAVVNVTSGGGIRRGVGTGDLNVGGTGKDEFHAARFPARAEK